MKRGEIRGCNQPSTILDALRFIVATLADINRMKTQ